MNENETIGHYCESCEKVTPHTVVKWNQTRMVNGKVRSTQERVQPGNCTRCGY